MWVLAAEGGYSIIFRLHEWPRSCALSHGLAPKAISAIRGGKVIAGSTFSLDADDALLAQDGVSMF